MSLQKILGVLCDKVKTLEFNLPDISFDYKGPSLKDHIKKTY